MINKVILVGRITKDVELKYTSTNIANCRFTVACNRPFKNADGDSETDFITAKAWRKTAELMSQYVKKGHMIGVEGRIQVDTYEGADGKTQWDTYVSVDNITFLESKDEKPVNQKPQKAEEIYQEVAKDITSDLPF